MSTCESFKIGDLVFYQDEARMLKECFFGIYVSSRVTKWSDAHVFHTILEVGGDVEEFMLRKGNEDKVSVVQRA